MNKPASMTIKEWIIKKMAIKMVVSEKVIEQVINFQFDSANQALSTNDTIEISGFGKFIFNTVKAEKQYAKYLLIKAAYEKILTEELSDKRRSNVERRLENIIRDIEILKPKIKNA
jgi:hypothetical protein